MENCILCGAGIAGKVGSRSDWWAHNKYGHAGEFPSAGVRTDGNSGEPAICVGCLEKLDGTSGGKGPTAPENPTGAGLWHVAEGHAETEHSQQGTCRHGDSATSVHVGGKYVICLCQRWGSAYPALDGSWVEILVKRPWEPEYSYHELVAYGLREQVGSYMLQLLREAGL